MPPKPRSPYRGGLNGAEQRAVSRFEAAQLEYKRSYSENLPRQRQDDLYILTHPTYNFWSAHGYRTFHLRNCKTLSALTDLRGYSKYEQAINAGLQPCRHCNPTRKHNLELTIPRGSAFRPEETLNTLMILCEEHQFPWEITDTYFQMETPKGIWRIHTDGIPYRMDHINKVLTPNNRTGFHQQPRLFLSYSDAFSYIKRHDSRLASSEDFHCQQQD